MKTRFLAALRVVGVFLCCLSSAALAQGTIRELASEATQDGEFITVTATAEIEVPRAVAFAVLTDWENYPKFIPDIEHSKVLHREGNGLILEQRGTMRFLFFTQPITLQLAIVESPRERVISRALSGNLRGFSGRYEIRSLPSGALRITQTARFIPSFSLPEAIGTYIVKSVFTKSFEAGLEEMLRRHASAAPKAAPKAAAADIDQRRDGLESGEAAGAS